MISATDISKRVASEQERKTGEGGEVSVDYLPLDLRPFRNAGVDLLGGSSPQLGRRTLRGIPFDIGADPRRCFVAVEGPSDQRVAIPVGHAVRRIVFAHRLFDPRPADLTAADGEMGSVV